MTIRTCLSLYLASLLAIACGDDSRAARTLESGIAADKPLAALTPQEALQLCDATLDAVSDFYPPELQLEVGCSVAASTLAIVFGPDGRPRIDPAACERHRDACIAEGAKSSSVQRSCDFSSPNTAQTCTATVGEFERCAAASLRAAAMFSQEHWTCAALAAGASTDSPRISAMQPPPLQVPECAQYEANCGPFEVPMM